MNIPATTRRISALGMSAFLVGLSPLPGPVPAFCADDPIPNYDLRLASTGKEVYLELDEAIAAVLRSNLEIKIEEIEPRLEEQRTLQALGEFEPAFESRFRYDNLDTPQTSQEFLGTGGDRFANGNLITRNRVFAEENFEAKAGIVGRLRSGAEYDFGVRTNRFRNDLTGDPTVGQFDPEYRTFTGLTFLQPLLQDHGREVNEAKITVSHRNTAIAHQAFRQKMSDIVKDVVAAYYDTFLAYEDAMVKRFEVEVLRRMVTEKRYQLDRGTATEAEVAAVRSRLAESYERFLLSRQTLLTRNGDLLMLIQQDFEFDSYPVFLPIDPPSVAPPELDPNRLFCDAKENRPSYLIALENVEKLGVMLKYRENQLLPRVDFEATLGISGLSGSYGAAFDNTYAGQGHEYGFGVVVNVPLGNTEGKALYAETENQRRQALIRVKKEEVETGIMINRHISAVRTHEKRLQAARMSTRISKESLDQARSSLEKGTITESALMKVERDVSETRLRQYAAAADLQKSLADLYDTSGILLQKYGIKVNEAGDSGESRDEAPRDASEKVETSNTADTDPPAMAENEPSVVVLRKDSNEKPRSLASHFHAFVGKPAREPGENETPAPESATSGAEPSSVAVPVEVAPGEEEEKTTGESAPTVATPVERKGLFRIFQ